MPAGGRPDRRRRAALLAGTLLLGLVAVPGHASPRERVDRHSCSQAFMPHVDPAEAAVRTAEAYVTAGVVQSQYEKVPAEPELRAYTRGATGAGRPAS